MSIDKMGLQSMKKLLVLILCSLVCFKPLSANHLGEEYIQRWKAFYPSKAVDRGFQSSIFDYEDYSSKSITAWLRYNEQVLHELSNDESEYVKRFPIDSRLLKQQNRREIEKWKEKSVHNHSLTLYSSLISKAIPSIIKADFLNSNEKNRIICERLDGIIHLSHTASGNLRDGKKGELERGLKELEATIKYLREKLQNHNLISSNCKRFHESKTKAISNIESLISFVRSELLPNAADSDEILGKEQYTKTLHLYLDTELTPEELANKALDEIHVTKKLMLETSKKYLQQKDAKMAIPTSDDETINMALSDMERDAPLNGDDYLQFWMKLSASAHQFIEDKEIATLPKNKTLRILSAPESAGAAARIGWVDSAPPFVPNPLTTLYLPSVPDTLEELEKKEFWASFNKPFNRMIVIHELLPGHYMQNKIARESPHTIRLLFPYGLYSEGWATFCERVALDAGWEEENLLTFLAHLRKRLENANRAYTSVMTHYEGWSKERVIQFSTETSLLAPQFAKSLWGRLMRSPMQLTSYFLGGQQFSDLLNYEKERLGEEFVLKEFMDTILKAGPIPIDAFYNIMTRP